MSRSPVDSPDQSRAAAEEAIVELFEECDYEVEEVVGDEPGSIVRFARPRSGFVKPRTCWTVWQRCPEVLEPALDELDAVRRRYDAERALAIVLEGSLPPGVRAGEDSRPVDVIPLRRFVLELTGIADEIRKLADIPEAEPWHPAQFIPRKALIDDRTVDAVEYIEEWLHNGRTQPLCIAGPPDVGKATLLRHIRYRQARAFVASPDTGPLLLTAPSASPLQTPLFDPGAVVVCSTLPVHALPDRRMRALLTLDAVDSESVSQVLEATHRAHAVRRYSEEQSRPHGTLSYDDAVILWLCEPEPETYKHWYRERLPGPAYQYLAEAWAKAPELIELATMPRYLQELVKAMTSMKRHTGTTQEWAARVTLRFLQPRIKRLDEEQISMLETGALEQFALGSSRLLARFRTGGADRRHRFRDEAAIPGSWFQTEQTPGKRYRGEEAAWFANRLIRDYFIARKIATEVRAGRLETLTRYQFPATYVLLFLAVISPEAAARVTADRTDELRAQIQSDVEREVQLVLGHQLRRSIGALRPHIKKIRKNLPKGKHEYELRRIDQELAFLSNLAEQTRKWHEVPEADKESLVLADEARVVLKDLHDAYHAVRVSTDIPAGVRVMASRDSLREILHCLLENAFHAVAYADDLDSPEVRLRARSIGETVRIDVIDNGPGVPEENREHVFEPRVTTKKGARGQPLGTGMGLAIARRYAERMGGRVGLEPQDRGSCFYVVLVAGRDGR